MKNFIFAIGLLLTSSLQAQVCVVRVDCKRIIPASTTVFPLRSALNQIKGDTVVGVTWQQLRGNSIISGSNFLNATVSNPSIDTNVYQFTAKTQSGKLFAALDTIIVTPPLPPTATITSNLSVIGMVDTLTVQAVDPNAGGGIVQIGWGKIAGPGLQTTIGANTQTCIVTGLQSGTYTYKCTVWNRAGLTGSATITFNVVQQKSIFKIVIYYMDGTIITVPVNQ